ncbi:hypothetical protein LJC07_03015 [Christensenellaceae bacterium OttesenSCG-928-L17]|nr:hypothetical protein [Christensenellaceae bacterium OttesenSCG-928-L17]
MENKMKNKVLLVALSLLLLVGTVLLIALPDETISKSERRTLAQFPPLRAEDFFGGDWTSDFETYLLDQFPFRDAMRGVKAGAVFYLFFQSDNNGIYLSDGHVFKINYPLDEASVQRFTEKLNTLYEKHMQDANVYYAIIPDKVQYATVGEKHLRTPHEEILAKVQAGMNPEMQSINLYDTLTLSDYYFTDLHWKQECLQGVVNRLARDMNFTPAELKDMRTDSYAPFYGAYYGQAALPMQTDTIYYLTDEAIATAIVEDLEHPDVTEVYNIDRLGETDSYDVYLSGATPLITLKNTQMQNGRKLILFRDSYGSSVAPLLLSSYETVILVDLRYLSSNLLEDYVDFSGSDVDVLFLYGEQLVNSSALLK